MSDGNRRLKKLFRSSKTPGSLDPLPPLPSPDPTATVTVTSASSASVTTLSSTLPQANNITSALPTPTTISSHSAPPLGNSNAGAPISTNSSVGSNSSSPIHDMHKRRQQQPPQHVQGSVTPFPLDAGRKDSAGSAAAVVAARRQVDGQGWDGHPSLAEMAQMEEEAASASYRRDAPEARFSGSRPRAGTAGSRGSLPPLENTWPVASVGSASSPVTQPAFYLPPGAGPPSPQIRPSTPPARVLQQTTSLPTAVSLPPQQANFVEGESFPNARARGYSSASQPEAKLGKGPTALGANRSPLASSHSEPQTVPGQPTAAQYPSWQNTPMGSERSTPRDDMERYEKNATPVPLDKAEQKEKEKKRFWTTWGQPKHKDKDARNSKESTREREQRERDRDVQAQREREVQAQRERDVQAQREREAQQRHSEQHAPPLAPPAVPFTAQMARASLDDSPASHDQPQYEVEPPTIPSNNGHASSIGHGESRPRVDMTPTPAEGNDVGSAIRKLAGSRETTHGAVLDVCERVNASSSGEAVGKEAARTMRKILKNGTDPERRMTLRIWWITMRTITVRNFRHYATNRKFMAAIEPIITQTIKPPPSASTLKACRDILSDLTFCNYKDRGCEGLYELWKRVKQPGDPEFGQRLPDDYLKHGTAGRTQTPTPTPVPPVSTGTRSQVEAPAALSRLGPNHRSGSPGSGYGPPYSSLPDHHEDMRRLIEECTAAKESARVLAEAVVFTSPEELEHKGVIKEFYTKCVLAHESLTNQMEWASSEAAKSRRVAQAIQQTEGQITTVEESALALLFEAHGSLTDSLKQYDDLEKMAMYDREVRAVQERSKKDMRMDRRQQMDMLMAGDGAQASSSRSPSPAHRTTPLPDEDKVYERPDSKAAERVSPVHEVTSNELANHVYLANPRGLSRTPSPDSARRVAGQTQGQAPPPPPKKMASPTRTDSPLGRARITGPRQPRGPLPNPNMPFRTVNSSQSLAREANVEPAPTHFRTTADGSEDDGEETRPSNKALGKRRADPDNTFDPDEMFKTEKPADSASVHSITADDLYLESLAKPIVYAYDAWAESELHRKEKGRTSSDLPHDGDLSSPASTDQPPPAPPKTMMRPNGNGERRAPAQNVEGYSLDPVAAR